MNAGLRLYSASKVDPEKPVVSGIFSVAIMTSVLAGIYTTVVFTLLTIYSKSALGLGKDTTFMNFLAATTRYRRTGFRMFLLSVAGTTVSFFTRYSHWQCACCCVFHEV
jgi:hypothetical protein